MPKRELWFPAPDEVSGTMPDSTNSLWKNLRPAWVLARKNIEDEIEIVGDLKGKPVQAPTTEELQEKLNQPNITDFVSERFQIGFNPLELKGNQLVKIVYPLRKGRDITLTRTILFEEENINH